MSDFSDDGGFGKLEREFKSRSLLKHGGHGKGDLTDAEPSLGNLLG